MLLFAKMTMKLHLQGHRDSCMCVICKQARRTGKVWAGMDARPALTASNARLGAARLQAVSSARFGKRAFVRCTGQFIRGPCNKQVIPHIKVIDLQINKSN